MKLLKQLAYTIFLFGGLFLGTVYGEERAESTLATTEAVRSITGWVELRPSWASIDREFHTENEVGLSWKINPVTNLSLVQEFQTALYNPTVVENSAFTLGDAYLKAEKDLGALRKDLLFSYEARLYFPTFAEEREKGFVSALRNYFILNIQFSESATIQLSETPVLYFYNRAGTTVDEENTANPFFENRFQIAFKKTFLNGDLLFNFATNIYTTQYRAYGQDGVGGRTWGHAIWIQPEVTYAIGRSTNVGVGYYSKNLIQEDFKAERLQAGLESGVYQAILQQQL